jgi:D-3-phosphoglycerate dehydrogenase
MTQKYKVVATDGLDKEAIEVLNKHPLVELVVHKGVEAAQLVSTLRDAHVVIIRSATNLKKEILSELPNLVGVVRAGVGTDNVDIKAAEGLGVWVWNAPSGNFQSTAELAVGMLFACARQIPFATEGARTGKWLKKEISAAGRQLSGSVLGIYGAGNIGLRAAKMASGIGMKVIVCDPIFKPSDAHPYEVVNFETLLAQSDFVTIHSPLLESTKHAFRYETFKKMKPSAIIVCAARGGIIKDEDLVRALDEKLIAGAGLDVFEVEPFPFDQPTYQKLLKDPRVVITPHVGASTIEAQRAVGLETADKIGRFLSAAKDSSLQAPRPLNKPATPRLKVAVEA